jgi:hypothetical protein
LFHGLTAWPGTLPVAKPSRQRRGANNKSARCVFNNAKKNKKQRKQKAAKQRALFQSPKRQNEYQGYRAVITDRPGNSIPILIGAVIIAAAILLSTLVTAVGTRFVGLEGPTDENMWLIDRLTGNVYKCQAADRGKASCEPETATGSIGERGKR